MSFGQTPGTSDKGIKRIFVTSLTEVSAVDLEGAGAIRREGGKTYKWVQYFGAAGAEAAVALHACYYTKPGTTTHLGGHKLSHVTSDLADSDEVGAGILQAVIPEASYGWVQIRGLATMLLALTAGANGNPLSATGAAVDGTLDLAAAASVVVAISHDTALKEIICDFPM